MAGFHEGRFIFGAAIAAVSLTWLLPREWWPLITGVYGFILGIWVCK